MSHDRTEDPGWTTLEIADRVDRVCDGFEAAWKRGERPAIVEYLSDATGSERSVLLREESVRGGRSSVRGVLSVLRPAVASSFFVRFG